MSHDQVEVFLERNPENPWNYSIVNKQKGWGGIPQYSLLSDLLEFPCQNKWGTFVFTAIQYHFILATLWYTPTSLSYLFLSLSLTPITSILPDLHHAPGTQCQHSNKNNLQFQVSMGGTQFVNGSFKEKCREMLVFFAAKCCTNTSRVPCAAWRAAFCWALGVPLKPASESYIFIASSSAPLHSRRELLRSPHGCLPRFRSNIPSEKVERKRCADTMWYDVQTAWKRTGVDEWMNDEIEWVPRWSWTFGCRWWTVGFPNSREVLMWGSPVSTGVAGLVIADRQSDLSGATVEKSSYPWQRYRGFARGKQ